MTPVLSRRANPVIDYEQVFRLAAPRTVVWEKIEQFDEFPTWWRWLRSFKADSSGLVAGNTLHGVVTPPLTRSFRVDVRLVRCTPRTEIEAAVTGDVEGPARLTLTDTDCDTTATVTWSLAMTHGAIREAALLAFPLVRWAHDRVVDVTVDSFQRNALHYVRRDSGAGRRR